MQPSDHRGGGLKLISEVFSGDLEVFKGVQRYSEESRGSQRYSEVFRVIQRFSEVFLVRLAYRPPFAYWADCKSS